ncbi:MAG: type II toxin-antitoxin system RelE/ParE family toxin [Nitrospirota bacterium]
MLIRGLHPALKRKIRAGLQQLLDEPNSGKLLRDELEGLRSMRVGRFRIIYRTGSGQIIEIVAVGPRQKIYEETLRRLRQETGQED